MNIIIIIKKWRKLYFLYTGLFLVSLLAGIFFYSGTNAVFNPQDEEYIPIFMNNVKVGLLMIFGGIMTGGVIPFVIMAANGFIIGNVFSIAVNQYSIFTLISGLFPHMFFELFALISCAVIGSFSGHFMVNYLRGRVQKEDVKLNLSNGFIIFMVSMVFFLIASLVEDYISTVVL